MGPSGFPWKPNKNCTRSFSFKSKVLQIPVTDSQCLSKVLFFYKQVGIPTKARAGLFQIGFGTKSGGPTWPYEMPGFTQNWAARSAFQII